jgi:S1-C subfamily serine protease
MAWQQRTVRLLLLLSGAAVVSLSGCSVPFSGLSNEKSSPEPLVNEQSPQGDSLPLGNASGEQDSSASRAILPSPTDPNFVVAAVQKVGPAVVRINAARTVTSQAPEGFDDPLLRRFFGSGPSAPPSRRVERGTGSGFIINSNGQILTNAHVVNGADTVNVTLKDGRTFEGEVLGQDPVTDVAVIQIKANNLPVIALGNSDVLQPGEWVIAIGNPLGLDNTVTAGIISATDRSSSDIGVADKRVGFIQTDTAINPGNSGGPLLNARGEVIGMNTAIISGAQGLGFAIPINTVQGIARQLISKGEVEHPYLGVQMVTLTPEIKQQLEIESDGRIRVAADQGVLLIRIVPGSPAAEAGLRAGDVIQSINNQPVNKTEEVQRLVERSTVGSQLRIQVQRNQRSAQVAVKLEALPVRNES